MNRASYGLQKWLYALILHGDILVNRFGLEAIVFLVLIFEFPTAFRTFPHNNFLTISLFSQNGTSHQNRQVFHRLAYLDRWSPDDEG